MNTVMTPHAATPRSGTAAQHTEGGTAMGSTVASGWYDPDGAGWDHDPVAHFEAARADTTPNGTRDAAEGDLLGG